MGISRLYALFVLPLLLGACSRKLPNAEIEKQLDALYPHTSGLGLTLEIKAEEKGDLLLLWKSKRRTREATYRPCPDVRGEDGMNYDRRDVEYERAGLTRRTDRPDLAFDARYERGRDVVLLELAEPAGQEFEVDGLVEARRLIDRWELSELEVRKKRRGGKTLAQFDERSPDEKDRARLFGERPQIRFLILGSPEWNEHLADLKKAREARQALIAKTEAPLIAAMAPGQEYWFVYDWSMNGKTAIRVRFQAGKSEADGRVQLDAPNKPEWDRTFRFERKPIRANTDYAAFPTAPTSVEAKAVVLFKERYNWLPEAADPTIEFSLREGKLILGYTRQYVLQREPIEEAGAAERRSDVRGAGPAAGRSTAATNRLPESTRTLTERAHGILQGRVAGSKSEAVELYAEAARAGDADAAVNLGHLYRAGRLVARDVERARQLYEQAAAAGNVEAEQALRGLR